MKKGILLSSLIMLVLTLVLAGYGELTKSTSDLLITAKYLGLGSLGTFLIGAVYPTY